MSMVSVIIPTYKRPDVVSRAIQSVIMQNYEDIEIIVVDDNVPDSDERKETEKVITEIKQWYPQLIYIMNKNNIGGSNTRNVGIFAAKGKYITFLDDDDEYLKGKISTQVKAMEENDWDVSVMDAETYDEKTHTLISVKKQKIEDDYSWEALMKIHLLYHITNVNTFMFKKSLLLNIHGFDDIPACQEYVLMEKTINNGANFGYIPMSLVRCYIGENERISTSLKKVPAQQMLIEKKKRYFGLLTKKEKEMVLCRHYGVLMNIYLKNKCFGKALKNLLYCIVASPCAAISYFLEYRKKIGG